MIKKLNRTTPKPKKRVHAFTKDVLGNYDAVALAAMVRKGDVSAEELAQAAIKRAQKVNEPLNAIEIKAFEAAVSQAKQSPKQGVFAGVPTFVKDNTDLKGFTTRNGSRAYTPHVAKENGPFANQFLAQGFTVIGKTQLPEFGFNPTTEFEHDSPTHNPWNTDYSSGGSSGGSAAMVAAGVVPIAHANDGGGSIRIPAACCGLVGLKPTRDRHLNNKTAKMMPLNLISEGVVTRSVRDTAAFMYGMETTYSNPKLKPIGNVEGPSNRKMHIGLVFDSIADTPTDAETRAAVQDVATQLEKLGHTVELMQLDIPKSFVDDFTLYWAMLAFMISTFGKLILANDFNGEKLDPFSKGLVHYYRSHILHTPVALFNLFRSVKQYAEMMKPYDAVLSPVLAHTVPKLGYLNPNQGFDSLIDKLFRYVMFTPLNNATGSPAISLPLAHSKDGLPIGIQLQASNGDEDILLDLAYQLEATMPFRKIQGK